MTANRRTFSWAIVTIAALLFTACAPVPAESEQPTSAPVPAESEQPISDSVPVESEQPISDSVPAESEQPTSAPVPAKLDRPISAPTRAAPLLSIHNPLVVQIGDTVTSSGGPLHDWPPGVEVEKHGLRIFHPYAWFFASSQEELLSLRPQLGDAATATAFLEEKENYFESLTPAGQEHLWAGMGFSNPNFMSKDTNGFHLLAVPTEGRTLDTYARELADRLEGSGFAAVESIEIGPGLRPWGEETATIRYRIDGTRAFREWVVTVPDEDVAGRQVILLSPDGGTFLTVTYDVWGEYPESVERLLLEVVRRVQWVEDPAYKPRPGPTVTLDQDMNVRGGPGTDHPIIGQAAAGQQYAVISRNAADDWWQIEYNGRLAWVHGGYVTPSVDAADAPQADQSGWLTYEDDARGLSLSYPPGWRYFDSAQPTQADLALFDAASRIGSGEVDAPGLAQTVSAMSYRRDDAVVGLGLQSGPPESDASNFMLLFSFPSNGMSLESYAQEAAEHTYSLSPATVELAQGLRPANEKTVSIRYLENETNSEVWQVWLLSPDSETLLALAFSVHSGQFEVLEPLLREIVQRLTWTER